MGLLYKLTIEYIKILVFLVNAAVEDSIESLGPYIRTLNHTDFKIHVHALRAAKVSKWFELPR